MAVLNKYVNNGGEYHGKDLKEIEVQENYKKIIKRRGKYKIRIS